MSRTEVVPEYPLTLQAAADIAANSLVKLDSAGKIVVATATDLPIGYIAEAVLTSAYAAVYELCGRMQLICGATGAIAKGHYVAADAAGKVLSQYVDDDPGPESNTPTVLTFGIAVSDAASEDDAVYVIAFK